jgi:hypothetical protein
MADGASPPTTAGVQLPAPKMPQKDAEVGDRSFDREPLRPGNLIRPKGTPEGLKISKGTIEDFSRTNR